jgi:hypothetical protein
MTDNDKTLIAVLLDRSGSMTALKQEVEGGFDAFIGEQKKVEGTCHVTLAQFDTTYEVVYERKPLDKVPPLDLQPRGCTALLDSMGRLITDTDKLLADMPKKKRPGAVIVAIMTDGMENSSHEWTHPAIKKLVQEKTDKDGWQFLYMGANQDAIEEGGKIGIAAANSITYGTRNAAEAMTNSGLNIASYRMARASGDVLASVAYSDAQRESALR